MSLQHLGWQACGLSVAIGVACAARLYVVLADQGLRLPVVLGALVAGGVVAAVVVHFVVPGWLAVRARRRLSLLQLALPSLCLLAGIVLHMLAPPKLPPFPGDPIQEIVVRAKGDKNAAASSREIWFRGIELADGTRISARDFEYSDNWWPRGSALLSTGRPPAEAIWRGPVSGPVQLYFDRHTHAGIVQVQTRDELISYDLYAADARKGVYRIVFPAPYAGLSQAYRHALYAGVIVTNAVALYVVAVLVGLLLVVLGAWFLPSRWRQERVWSVAVIRVASIAVLLGFAMSTGRASGVFSLGGYWERAWQPTKARLKARQQVDGFHVFLREKLPPGALVLADANDGATLTMTYACHVMRTHPTGIAWFNHEQLFADYEALMDADLPWGQRRDLLRRYELRWVYFSKANAAKHPWLAKIALESHPFRQHILFHLPPVSKLPTSLDDMNAASAGEGET